MLKRTCSVDGCEDAAHARGVCPKHYQRLTRLGGVDLPPPRVRPSCSVEGCPHPHRAKGLCDTHYARWRRTGDPLGSTLALPSLPVLERRCPRCSMVKDRSMYDNNLARRDGMTSWCRACNAARAKVYAAANREKLNAANRRLRRNNPERSREAVRRSRAKAYADPIRGPEYRKRASEAARWRIQRLKDAPGHVSDRDWTKLWNRFYGLCAYCGLPATERDHVIPLNRGGRNTIGNLLPSCRSCNAQKSAKLLAEWRYKG